MEIIITSIIAFTSTNLDDIFILTLFFGNKQFKEKDIVAGQLLGISTLIIISMIGSLIGFFIHQSYIGLLGFIPVYLGIKGIYNLFHNEANDESKPIDQNNQQNKILTVAGVTIANGGDNIGIYVPLFATLTWINKVTMTGIFLGMTILWCVLARYFVKHPVVAKVVAKYGHLVTPIVLVLIGIYILYENKTIELIKF